MNKVTKTYRQSSGNRNMFKIFAVGLTLFLVSQASAGVVVIVSPGTGLDSLSQSQVKSIFLGKVKSLPTGESAIPVNQTESSAVYDSFNDKVLGKSSAKVLQYWASRVFSGKGSPPEVVSDDQAVIDFVSSRKGAIGYVDSASVGGSVKVIYTAN